MRGAGAVTEALETLEKADLVDGEVSLTSSFDEFNVFLTLKYAGKKIELDRTGAPELEALLVNGDEDAIDATMKRVSMALLVNLADKITSEQRGETAFLHFQFEH